MVLYYVRAFYKDLLYVMYFTLNISLPHLSHPLPIGPPSSLFQVTYTHVISCVCMEPKSYIEKKT